ncbi:MAG: hypothetical protein AUG51_12350 [Acidobacteria bacterium 13_1_20CM_3_53_8]|nr:MAG: hypothetical protein AUG51_12350 [Acidobacteria bacterium 13_1_20CM_3_53_8]
MKLKSLITAAAFTALSLCAPVAQAQRVVERTVAKNRVTVVSVASVTEQTAAASENVVVTLSNISGHLKVHGWDRREVHVKTEDAKRVELRREDSSNSSSPATRLQVLFARETGNPNNIDLEECGEESDVTLDVPRGATVFLKTQSGDIEIEDIAEAHVETSSGDVSARHISKAIEMASASGDLTIEDSAGRVRAVSISGDVDAVNLRANDASDFIRVKSVSGDVNLNRVSHARIDAGTVSGELSMIGPTVRGGSYEFQTVSGDVTLNLPSDASFRLDAQIFQGGDVSTDFNFSHVSRTVGSPIPSTHFVGTYGTGDATINMRTISGTLRVRRR